MEEKELKTSLKQRIGIIMIAVIMLGSVIASYAAIVMSGNGSSASGGISEEKMAQYESEYAEKLATFRALSESDYKTFIANKSVITAYDEAAANAGSVTTKDLVTGSGRTLESGDTNYLAYYVGWCADGSVFDSSLDDVSEPTAFMKALNASQGMIDGWNTGVVGMKLGGVREITLPGKEAYGEQMEICGGYNKPLKFLVMAVANEDPLKTAASELDTAYMKVQYGYYGIDYEAL